MANITLTFTNPLPEGVQVGNIAWYLNTTNNLEIEMGPITSKLNIIRLSMEDTTGRELLEIWI